MITQTPKTSESTRLTKRGINIKPEKTISNMKKPKKILKRRRVPPLHDYIFGKEIILNGGEEVPRKVEHPYIFGTKWVHQSSIDYREAGRRKEEKYKKEQAEKEKLRKKKKQARIIPDYDPLRRDKDRYISWVSDLDFHQKIHPIWISFLNILSIFNGILLWFVVWKRKPLYYKYAYLFYQDKLWGLLNIEHYKDSFIKKIRIWWHITSLREKLLRFFR